MTLKRLLKRSPKKYVWVVFNSKGLAVGVSIENAVAAWNDFYEYYEGPDGWPHAFPDTFMRHKQDEGYTCKRIKITT